MSFCKCFILQICLRENRWGGFAARGMEPSWRMTQLLWTKLKSRPRLRENQGPPLLSSYFLELKLWLLEWLYSILSGTNKKNLILGCDPRSISWKLIGNAESLTLTQLYWVTHWCPQFSRWLMSTLKFEQPRHQGSKWVFKVHGCWFNAHSPLSKLIS